MFSTEPIFIEASTDIVITRLVQLSSWCTFRHIGDLIYFRPFVLFLKNQSESLLKRIFRESLVSSSLRSKERRLEVREWTKQMKAPPKKVGSAQSNVYTTHFIRARLIFLAPGLGLLFQKGQARVKFWFGRDNIWYCKVLYTTKFTRAEPFFWVLVPFLSEPVPKIFRSINGASDSMS